MIFFIVDFKFFREEKLNEKIYVLERFLILGALISSCLINYFTHMLVALGACVGIVFLIKGYYIVLRFIQYW